MTSSEFDKIFPLFLGLIAGLIFGFLIFSPTEEHDFKVVCDYRGGTVQGNVCIIDGKVVSER